MVGYASAVTACENAGIEIPGGREAEVMTGDDTENNTRTRVMDSKAGFIFLDLVFIGHSSPHPHL